MKSAKPSQNFDWRSGFARRDIPFAACVISVIACLAYAALRSNLPTWWRSHGGGIPYVVFWILAWYVLIPNRKFASTISIGCVLLTCCLEWIQAWDLPQSIDNFRHTRVGAAWLGNGFDWHDIPPYFLGGLVGYFVIRFLAFFETDH